MHEIKRESHDIYFNLILSDMSWSVNFPCSDQSARCRFAHVHSCTQRTADVMLRGKRMPGKPGVHHMNHCAHGQQEEPRVSPARITSSTRSSCDATIGADCSICRFTR